MTIDDAPYLFEFYSKDIVTKYLPFKTHRNLRDTQKFIKSFFLQNYKEGKIGHFAIVLKEDNNVIGNIGFNNIYRLDKEGEIGICINPSYWGYDLSTELAIEMLRYGFNDLNLHKIVAVTFGDNKYSQKPLLVLGFKHVKIFKKKVSTDKKIVNCHRFELSKKDYIKRVDGIVRK